MILVASFAFSILESLISRENGLIWRLSSVRRGGGRLLEGRLKEGGVHKLFLILGGTFIGGRRLKEVGLLLEDLP